MPRDVCAIPPGRRWAVENCWPIIPPGVWAHVQEGRGWPAGIAKGLRETAHCHAQETLCLHDGTIVRMLVAGFFPWGWYRCPKSVEPDPVPTAEEDAAGVREILRAGAVPRSPLVSGRWSPLVSGCGIEWVPTVDQWIPFPIQDQAWAPTTAGSERIVPGAYGRYCLRLPGADHPWFSSGLAVAMFPEWALSDLGRRRVAYARDAGSRGLPFFDMVGSWPVPAFGQPQSSYVIPLWSYTAPFNRSHMQCLSPLRYPPSYADRGIDGIVGQEVGWRWRHGGDAPAHGSMLEHPDVFEVLSPLRHFPGGGLWVGAWPLLWQCLVDAAGAPKIPPEGASGWGSRKFAGPEPGAFA